MFTSLMPIALKVSMLCSTSFFLPIETMALGIFSVSSPSSTPLEAARITAFAVVCPGRYFCSASKSSVIPWSLNISCTGVIFSSSSFILFLVNISAAAAFMAFVADLIIWFAQITRENPFSENTSVGVE